jgi:hypothetical protein
LQHGGYQVATLASSAQFNNFDVSNYPLIEWLHLVK